MSEELYVALTALQSHWGEPENTVMLGEWCRTLYENETYRENAKYAGYRAEVLSRRWLAPDELDRAAEYCRETAHAVAPVLAEHLLRELKITSLDNAALKRIFWAWLQPFTFTLYDRYLAIQDAAAFDSDACCITAPPEATVFPAESPLDGVGPLAHGVSVDTNNLILFSRIISFLGLQQKVVPLQQPPYPAIVQWARQKRSFKGKIWNLIRYARGICRYPHPLVLLSSMYMGVTPQYSSWIADDLTPPGRGVAINHDIRSKGLDYGNCDFTRLLAKLIPAYIPWGICEGLPGLVAWAKTHPVRAANVFITALGNNTNVPLMVLANVLKRPLVVMDHSGGASAFEQNSPVDVLNSVSTSPDPIAQRLRRELPSSQLSRALPKFSEPLPPVLVCNEIFRYVIREYFGRTSSYAKVYHQARIVFLRAIPAAIMPTVRLYFKEFGWEVKSTLQKQFPLLHFQDPYEVPMDRVYAAHSLLVCDHQISTFHFALARNIPLLSFTAPGLRACSEQGRYIIEALEKAKIHHGTPESAAKHYCDIYENIDAWWKSDEVQKARKVYTNAYVNMSDDWQRDWNRLITDAVSSDGATDS